MTETKHLQEHDTSEFILKLLGYIELIKDEIVDEYWKLEKNATIKTKVYNDTTGVVQLHVEVNLKNQNKMYIGSFYHQPDHYDNKLV